VIENIKLSLKKSLESYENNQKSIHWNNFLKEKFLNLKIEDLNNFRNNGLSDGMDNVHFNKINNELRLKQFNQYLLKNHETIDKYYKYFPKKNIGNCPNQIETKGGYVDYMFIETLMFYLELKKSVFKNNYISNICEIGGGFGSLARIIMLDQQIKYFIIDLPETIALSTFFLNQNYPNKKILTYNNIKNKNLSAKDVADYDIIMVPPWVNFEHIKIDLFINTRSMMEMNFDTIKKYFKFIQKNISNEGYFFNCNRYYKDTVGHPIKFHEYPYDKFWKVISSEPTWNQRRLHTLITKRVSEKTSDIEKEMLKIKFLAKNHTPHFLQTFKIFNFIKKFLKL
jgi:putative sugar O-methyltransferase